MENISLNGEEMGQGDLEGNEGSRTDEGGDVHGTARVSQPMQDPAAKVSTLSHAGVPRVSVFEILSTKGAREGDGLQFGKMELLRRGMKFIDVVGGSQSTKLQFFPLENKIQSKVGTCVKACANHKPTSVDKGKKDEDGFTRVERRQWRPKPKEDDVRGNKMGVSTESRTT
ncbi:hypothetical protein L6452_42329 [Arctium lappa]|uniref:Uncharacterized protein n=1 Tax=Arctium lappa TaxID=4217 RepID=A0ACB8XHY5_ARCLA|nr:hypothetical protein L6452_42329 [Arctium lappa]